MPSERLLQQIWLHQRLLRDQLKTSDGTPVRVLHPGFWNREAGPDFRNSIVQIGQARPTTGDIEIDLVTGGWRQHGHAGNPEYKNVILHITWAQPEREASPVPALCLEDCLDAPVEELQMWFQSEAPRQLPESSRGQCAAPLAALDGEMAGQIVRQAAMIRFQGKAAQLEARSRQAGWEQALWEALFGALGYKHNAWPMRRLAEFAQAGRPALPRRTSAVLSWQARLLGASNQLPFEFSKEQVRQEPYLRELWDVWWRERDSLADWILPKQIWRLAGVRPANHPQRRIALAAHWLANGGLPAKLEQWAAKPLKTGQLLPSLAAAMKMPADDFWDWHWTLRSGRLKERHSLLGEARITDLAINVILPWIWIRAVVGKNDSMRAEMERRYFDWPEAQDNALLRLVRLRLMGQKKPAAVSGAAGQQGLLQIVRDFCDHSDAICSKCPFPELVRSVMRDEGQGYQC